MIVIGFIILFTALLLAYIALIFSFWDKYKTADFIIDITSIMTLLGVIAVFIGLIIEIF